GGFANRNDRNSLFVPESQFYLRSERRVFVSFSGSIPTELAGDINLSLIANEPSMSPDGRWLVTKSADGSRPITVDVKLAKMSRASKLSTDVRYSGRSEAKETELGSDHLRVQLRQGGNTPPNVWASDAHREMPLLPTDPALLNVRIAQT